MHTMKIRHNQNKGIMENTCVTVISRFPSRLVKETSGVLNCSGVYTVSNIGGGGLPGLCLLGGKDDTDFLTRITSSTE